MDNAAGNLLVFCANSEYLQLLDDLANSQRQLVRIDDTSEFLALLLPRRSYGEQVLILGKQPAAPSC